jgi:hypothetical protein
LLPQDQFPTAFQLINPHRSDTTTFPAPLHIGSERAAGFIAPIGRCEVFEINNQGIGTARKHCSVHGIVSAWSKEPSAAYIGIKLWHSRHWGKRILRMDHLHQNNPIHHFRKWPITTTSSA